MLLLIEHHIATSALTFLAQQLVAELAALVLRVSLGMLFIVHLDWKLAVAEGGFRQWWANFETNGYHSSCRATSCRPRSSAPSS